MRSNNASIISLSGQWRRDRVKKGKDQERERSKEGKGAREGKDQERKRGKEGKGSRKGKQRGRESDP